jgi:CheY-like chemotaxis protein
MCFLIIDDNASPRSLIARYLERESILTKTAANANDALIHLNQGNLEGVYLDLNLGNSVHDGISVLRTIRGGIQNNLPVCVISADKTLDSLFSALLFQADLYLCKSDDVFVLKKEIINFAHSVKTGSLSTKKQTALAAYLGTRGLTEKQTSLLLQYYSAGFLEPYCLSDNMGISENAINKMFGRILKTLGYEHKAQLHQLLTILSGFDLSQITQEKTNPLEPNVRDNNKPSKNGL